MRMQTVSSTVLALLLSLFDPAASAAETDSPRRLGHPSMGSVLHCEWAPLKGAEKDAEHALESALAEADRVEAALSHYRPESELNRFNALPASASWTPSPILEAMFSRSEAWRARSGGAFSCRLEPWLRRRGFIPGPSRQASEKVSETDLTSPTAITLGPEGLTKRVSGAGLDFDGIAKGYALDLAAKKLEGRVAWAFLSYGSSGILVGEGDGRVLAIPDPRRSGPDAPTAVAVWLHGGSFSTSSCAENLRDGTCHIVDPRTLAPVGGALVSATAFAPSATDADALSTAFMALGPEGARDLALRCGAEAVLITREPLAGSASWKGIWVFITEGLRPWAEVAP